MTLVLCANDDVVRNDAELQEEKFVVVVVVVTIVAHGKRSGRINEKDVSFLLWSPRERERPMKERQPHAGNDDAKETIPPPPPPPIRTKRQEQHMPNTPNTDTHRQQSHGVPPHLLRRLLQGVGQLLRRDGGQDVAVAASASASVAASADLPTFQGSLSDGHKQPPEELAVRGVPPRPCHQEGVDVD